MALYTKKLIMDSFQEMLEEMPFDKITVTALVKRAGVSPNTFYYNYQDIFALLDAWLKRSVESFLSERELEEWKDITKNILTICRQHSKIIYHVFDSLSRDRLERYLFSLTDDVFYRLVKQLAEDKEIPENRLREIAAFCRYAYFGFILQFLWNNMEVDIDRAVEDLGVLFDDFLEVSINQYDSK